MTTPIKIRPALDGDAERLSQMICENAQAVLSPHYNNKQWAIFIKYYSPEVMHEKISEQYVFCAELNGQIVGTIALDKDFVVGFYTRLQYLNRGIGKTMMKHLEEFALKKGLTEIQLAASPEGLSFYYKNGWKKVKDFIIEHYGVGFEETLMIKKIEKVLSAVEPVPIYFGIRNYLFCCYRAIVKPIPNSTDLCPHGLNLITLPLWQKPLLILLLSIQQKNNRLFMQVGDICLPPGYSLGFNKFIIGS